MSGRRPQSAEVGFWHPWYAQLCLCEMILFREGQAPNEYDPLLISHFISITSPFKNVFSDFPVCPSI